ncbi:phage portal protein family protein [Nocardia sp. CA-290969]|uniref:phage portal protein family protein n=1 Tax=Nocardia sp. CA-290969 TaxID=3239986 RepID=UPI003D91CC94
MPTEIKPAKPAFREKGYVNGQIAGHDVGHFSQWEQYEQVPDLQWPASVGVFTRMKREDSRVSSLLAAIGLPIRRTSWRVAPNGARDEVTEFVARNLALPIDGGADLAPPGRRKGRFSWAQHLVWALTVNQYGHSVFEQVYRDYGDGRVWLHKLAPRPQRTISAWNVAADGGLESIEQMAPAASSSVMYGITPLTIPISRLVVYTREMEPGRWVGESLLRPSYKHWILKDELMRIEAVAARRNGVGVPVATGAEGASQSDIDKLADMASKYRVGEHSGAGLPFGAKLELLGVQGNLPDIRAGIAYHDNMIAIAGLAHFLNLSGGGSYALASVQANTFVESVQTFAESIRDTANQHVVEDLVDVNFGVDEPAPQIVFDEIGSRQDATAAALKMLVEAGLLSPDVLVEQTVRQRLGLPARPENAPAAPEPAATPAPAATPVAARRRNVPAEQGALW